MGQAVPLGDATGDAHSDEAVLADEHPVPLLRESRARRQQVERALRVGDDVIERA